MKWKKVFGLETRDASYTDALVNLIQAQAGGIEPDSSALGALEVAAGSLVSWIRFCKVGPYQFDHGIGGRLLCWLLSVGPWSERAKACTFWR